MINPGREPDVNQKTAFGTRGGSRYNRQVIGKGEGDNSLVLKEAGGGLGKLLGFLPY